MALLFEELIPFIMPYAKSTPFEQWQTGPESLPTSPIVEYPMNGETGSLSITMHQRIIESVRNTRFGSE